MHIIKLDATESTNDFLKSYASGSPVRNYTVVTAQSQTRGRGQMGAKWVSESGKNLIMSILVKDYILDPARVFDLNIIVSMAVFQSIEVFGIAALAIKWPNDIMADNKKIGGILIENIIKGDGAILSVAGIGLNVNQTNFDGLPRASSLAAILGREFDPDRLAIAISERIQQLIELGQTAVLKDNYTAKLFRKDHPTAFESDGATFMGMIRGVDDIGKLLVELENGSVKAFDLKQIAMRY